MRKVLVVTIAAFTLGACGNSGKTTKGPSAAPNSNAQRLHQSSARIAQSGVAATEESIIGKWCSIDSMVEKTIDFAKNGTATVTTADGEVKRGGYYLERAGVLNLSGKILKATIAEATEALPKLLSLSSDSETDLMEPCQSEVEPSGQDEDETQEPAQSQSEESPNQEQQEKPEVDTEELPEAPKST